MKIVRFLLVGGSLLFLAAFLVQGLMPLLSLICILLLCVLMSLFLSSFVLQGVKGWKLTKNGGVSWDWMTSDALTTGNARDDYERMRLS